MQAQRTLSAQGALHTEVKRVKQEISEKARAPGSHRPSRPKIAKYCAERNFFHKA
jgi:hypothetical protein